MMSLPDDDGGEGVGDGQQEGQHRARPVVHGDQE